MKHLFLFASILLLFNSCEKEKELMYEDYQSSTLIRQIGTSEEDMQIITYYNSTNVFEHLERFSYRKFIYNQQNQLERIDIALTFNPLSCAIIPGTSFEDGDDPRKAKIGRYVEYNYSSEGTIENTYNYFINEDTPQLMSYETYQYDNDHIIRINLFNPENDLTQYQTYLYDKKGNVLEEKSYFMIGGTDATLQGLTLYEYDEKINPLQVFSVVGTPGIYTNKNNITKQIRYYYYSEIEETYVDDFSYEYNDLAYPVLVNNLEYIYGEDE